MSEPTRGLPREGRPNVARGRSRGIPPPVEGPSGSPGAPVTQMESLELGLLSVSRGGRSAESSTTLTDRYSEPGSGNGNGYANGSDGGRNGNNASRDTSPPGQRGNPRGRLRRGDFVASRPGELASKCGSVGEKVGLVANYFELQRKQEGKEREWRLYKYCVQFTPEIDHKGKRKGVLRTVQAQIGANIFDGVNLYVSRPIPEEALNITVEDREGAAYILASKLVEELNPTDPMYITFYNLVLKKCQKMLQMTEMGRNYFDDQQAIKVPQYNLELWPGFITSIKQNESQVMMCVEVTHKVLRLDNVFSLMSEMREQAHQRSQDFRSAIATELTGTIVMTEYNKRTYRVDEIMWDLNPSYKFTLKDKEITVADYLKEKYGSHVRSMKQPLLASLPKKRDQHRGITEPFYLVPELCRMTGLNDSLRSNFQLMRSLAEHLHMVPEKRIHSVCRFVNRMMDNDEIRQELRSWGLRFKTEPVEISGRILPKQGINFAGDRAPEIPDAKADWTIAFRSRAMLSTVGLNQWVILVPDRDASGVDGLCQTMNQVSRTMNFRINRPREVVRVQGSNPQAYIRAIREVMGKYGQELQMLFVILGTNKLDTYSAVKKLTYVEYGIPSQCFLAKNIRAKGIMAISTKIVVQMNAKLGGEPWSVAIPMQNTMIVGFDVYHVSTEGRRGQAVGAILATTTKNATRYFSAVSFHSDDEELSANLVADFNKCLLAYKGVNGQFPDKIVFYRDGVGQGQLSVVYEQELVQLKKTISDVYRDATPPTFTFIVVSKKINTRLFQLKGQFQADNPAPGTVVDDVVTLPERYDFFIVAQSARQGTVSPTSYNVLSDNSGLTPDRLQALSYKLCHLYYNWSGTVAVPAPVQYAHKLAFLMGTALGARVHGNLDNLLYFL